MEFWSWWKGALALGALTVFFVLMLGRMLGVSGSWANIINWREERKRQQAASAFRTHAAVMQNALLAATLAEFGEQKTQQALAGQGIAIPAPRTAAAGGSMRWTVHVTFLAAMIVGGFLAAIAGGYFEIRLDLGATHLRLFGAEWREWLTLLGGGALVGFGTQMGGGCTSGHGLSGLARLVPTSIVATATFFGSAVAVSFLLETLSK